MPPIIATCDNFSLELTDPTRRLDATIRARGISALHTYEIEGVAKVLSEDQRVSYSVIS